MFKKISYKLDKVTTRRILFPPHTSNVHCDTVTVCAGHVIGCIAVWAGHMICYIAVCAGHVIVCIAICAGHVIGCITVCAGHVTDYVAVCAGYVCDWLYCCLCWSYYQPLLIYFMTRHSSLSIPPKNTRKLQVF